MASLSIEKLVIPFSSLVSEDEMFEYFLRPEEFEDQDAVLFPQDLKVTARIQKVESDYLLFLKVTGEVKLICDRCGESFAYQIDSTLNTLFSFSSLENEDDVSEVRRIKASDRGISIGQDIRDAVALAIPVKRLCDKNCKGLCPHCGKDLNKEACQCDQNFVDPRWDALKNLKFDK